MENVYLWSFWWLPGVIDDVVSTTVRCTVWWHVADLCFALSVDSCPITKCSNFFLKLIILLCAVPLLLAGMQPSRSGCPEPNLTWSRTLPGMGHPQFLQASFFQWLTILTIRNFFITFGLNLLSFSLRVICLNLWFPLQSTLFAMCLGESLLSWICTLLKIWMWCVSMF